MSDALREMSGDGVVVVGAGIVGMSSALALQRVGCRVVVIDHRPPGHGASFGHAGGIAVTWVSPQGLPKLMRRLPKWVLDPLGPVAVRWPYLPRLLPWFLRLRHHSSSGEVERLGDALASLMAHAWPAWEGVLTDCGPTTAGLIRHDGSLSAYRERGQFEDDDVMWEMRRRRGFRVEVLEGGELRSFEPALAPDFAVGVFEPEAKWCEDPMAVIGAMVDRFLARGGVVVEQKVEGFTLQDSKVRAVRTSTETFPASEVVLAAGAWSHRLAAQLGHRLPLESERGYHVDVPEPGVELARILSLGTHKVVATPMRHGLRLSGTAEFGGVDSRPDFRRAAALVEVARRALPGLEVGNSSEWAGDRPIFPDSLPVIGRDPRFSNVCHAYGHSHIGFTLGPVTGELVAQVITGGHPSVNLAPFRVDRFT